MTDLDTLCEAVYDANLALVKNRLVILTWGNVSAIDRERGLIVIKPSGVPYKTMKAQDMTVVDLSGQVVRGAYKPSSDTATHLELYRAFPGAGAVVHTHAPSSTIWAQAGRDLPAYGTTHADYFHGPVPCTRALSQAEVEDGYEANTGHVITECFRERHIDASAVPAVLVSGHASFIWGRDALNAVENAVVLEEVARMALETERLSPGIGPLTQHLLDKHYFRKHGSKAYYGQS